MNRELSEELLELLKYSMCTCCAKEIKIDVSLSDKEFSDEVESLFMELCKESRKMEKGKE
jgi:hypothetical protein